MPEALTLYGYRYSVYCRIVAAVLAIKRRNYSWKEVSPFGETDPTLVKVHPFNRVPVLSHGSFTLYETAAITGYLDRAFPQPLLTPQDAMAEARMHQVIRIIDTYGYWPMARQVFGQRVFRPLVGEPADETEVAQGLARSKTVLAALEDIALEGLVLTGSHVTLADCHLAPMIAYFTAAPEGGKLLNSFPRLTAWWQSLRGAPWMTLTEPDLSSLGPHA